MDDINPFPRPSTYAKFLLLGAHLEGNYPTLVAAAQDGIVGFVGDAQQGWFEGQLIDPNGMFIGFRPQDPACYAPTEQGHLPGSSVGYLRWTTPEYDVLVTLGLLVSGGPAIAVTVEGLHGSLPGELICRPGASTELVATFGPLEGFDVSVRGRVTVEAGDRLFAVIPLEASYVHLPASFDFVKVLLGAARDDDPSWLVYAASAAQGDVARRVEALLTRLTQGPGRIVSAVIEDGPDGPRAGQACDTVDAVWVALKRIAEGNSYLVRDWIDVLTREGVEDDPDAIGLILYALNEYNNARGERRDGDWPLVDRLAEQLARPLHGEEGDPWSEVDADLLVTAYLGLRAAHQLYSRQRMTGKIPFRALLGQPDQVARANRWHVQTKAILSELDLRWAELSESAALMATAFGVPVALELRQATVRWAVEDPDTGLTGFEPRGWSSVQRMLVTVLALVAVGEVVEARTWLTYVGRFGGVSRLLSTEVDRFTGEQGGGFAAAGVNALHALAHLQVAAAEAARDSTN